MKYVQVARHITTYHNTHRVHISYKTRILKNKFGNYIRFIYLCGLK